MSEINSDHFITHGMKSEWKNCLDCVAGFFFTLEGKGVERTWPSVEDELRGAIRHSDGDYDDLIGKWLHARRTCVEKKERQYGVAWSMNFTKTADWATQVGMSASKSSVAAEVHLFSRPATALHFKRTYECPKIEEPRMCFLDCVLKFNEDGSIVEDKERKAPRNCRFYQFFDFPLLDNRETEEDKKAANDALQTFLSATWHGNAGAHHAEMMALTLAYAGREVGRFFILPDRSDSGKTTHNLALCYFLGGEESSGRGTMSGTLHAEWLCDDKALGFEGHHILHCKFTLTPELSTKPILNDVYKRIPTNVCQKLRKPHSAEVFDGSFGKCVHFLETNYTPRMLYPQDELGAIVKRSLCIIFSRKRAFARQESEVDEESGVFLMKTADELRRSSLTPSTRRAFFRYWINFTKEYPVSRCDQMLGDLDLFDQEFGSTLHHDTEEFCRSMIAREEEGGNTTGNPATSKEIDASDAYDILRKVHVATGGHTHVKTYVIRSLSSDVIEGLKTETSLKHKAAKIENFKAAISSCAQGKFLELFRIGTTPNEYLRLDVNLEMLEALASDSGVFGRPCDWGDVLSARYQKCFPVTETNTSKVEGVSKEPIVIREILDVEGLETFWSVCSDKHKSACSDLIGKAVATPDQHTIGALAVPYANTNAYGRKYARGPSLQKIGREGRDAALRKIGVDVDMENCHPSLMRILLERTHRSDGEDVDYVRRTYPMMMLYVDNYKKWRIFCMEYYKVDLEVAKGYILKIYYGGGCPKGDVPFLHALRVEVGNATKYLTSHRFYERLGSYYSSRRNPSASHLSAILSFEEDSLLSYICQAMERPPICLMYDGAVFACGSIEDVSKSHQICASLSVELGVGVCIKQWRSAEEALGVPSVRSTCADLRQEGRAENLSPLDGVIGREACLYNSIRYLDLPECYDFPKTNGPFSVEHYNRNVRS